jgi:SAM-dependent methyltransferase
VGIDIMVPAWLSSFLWDKSSNTRFMPTTYSHCQICGATKHTIFARKLSCNQVDMFTLKQCSDCGFIWVEPFPGYEVYNDDYYRGNGPDPSVDYEEEYKNCFASRRLPEFINIWQLVRSHILRDHSSGKSIKVLDYGCGAGGFMEFARASAKDDESLKNFEIHGFDIGSYASRLSREKNFRILNENEISSHSAIYDVITCIEVLEHSGDVNCTMRNIARLLKPGGFLILTTGNLNCLAAKISGSDYRYIIPDIHVSLFNPDCLSALYQKHGLSPVNIKYDGVLEHKVLKSLRSRHLKKIAHHLLRVPGVIAAVDWIYGVSAMPCAIKPSESKP